MLNCARASTSGDVSDAHLMDDCESITCIWNNKAPSQRRSATSAEGDWVTWHSLGNLSPIRKVALWSGLGVINRAKVKVSKESN